ncbi:hypothetical protein F5141DRAFT_779293 [Pisolithus sp. B1]|nr:hypothetical protein F5141DRAFT_779293 [Pisolithus sp. B1]
MATSPSDPHKLPGLRESTSLTSLPALVFAPHCSHSWGAGDIDESSFLALYSDSDCSHSGLARNHAVQGGTTRFFVTDPTEVYPSPPPSKATASLPERTGESLPFYSAQLPCILDSPVVMRREDLAYHGPLTPPPTLPHSTFDLPDSDGDADVRFAEEDTQDSDHDFDGDELFGSPSGSSQSTVDIDLPLSPISPMWESQGSSDQHGQLSFMSDSPPHSGHIWSFWLPFGEKGFSPSDTTFDSANPHPSFIPHAPSSLLEFECSDSVKMVSGLPLVSEDGPSSLLEIDELRPVEIHWSPYDVHHMPAQSPTPYIPSPVLCADDLETPSSPLPRHTSLPEDDDIKDVQMSDSSEDSSFSPGHPLLGLPGANTDDSLLPIAFDPRYGTNDSEPLLLIDDPQDIPAVRSPSPDDLRLLSDLPPEGSQLFDMRRRYMAGEKTFPDASRASTQAEAKRGRKRDAERSKEIGALLCLKFPDKVVKCRKEKSSESCRSVDGVGISGDGNSNNGDYQPNGDQQQPSPCLYRPQPTAGMAQLVAQMVLRRNETSRPLPWKKAVTRYYVKSPLSHAIADDAGL